MVCRFIESREREAPAEPRVMIGSRQTERLPGNLISRAAQSSMSSNTTMGSSHVCRDATRVRLPEPERFTEISPWLRMRSESRWYRRYAPRPPAILCHPFGMNAPTCSLIAKPVIQNALRAVFLYHHNLPSANQNAPRERRPPGDCESAAT